MIGERSDAGPELMTARSSPTRSAIGGIAEEPMAVLKAPETPSASKLV
jgi:hypothetical protein